MSIRAKAAILLIPVILAVEPLHGTELNPEDDVYRCSIVKYGSEDTTVSENVTEPFSVTRGGRKDPASAPTVITGEGREQLSWHIWRFARFIRVEVATKGRVFAVSTTAIGSPIDVKIPATKNNLSCYPSSQLAKVDMGVFGKSVRRQLFLDEALGRKDREPLLVYRNRVASAVNELLTREVKNEDVRSKIIDTVSDMAPSRFAAVFASRDIGVVDEFIKVLIGYERMGYLDR